MKTAFISHPDTLLHVMDGSHPESPARITAIKDQLLADGILPQLDSYQAPLASDQDLLRVHTPAYVRYIRRVAPLAGLVKLDQDTAMGPMSLSACLHASGALIKATDLVMQGNNANAFCCTRPPGHHAGRANAAGFCIFNHVAVGAAYAMQRYGVKRIAIIDFDVHHGDGTEDIFREDPRVMLCSTFQHPYYPHKGADSRTERMINIPIKAGATGSDFQTAFQQEFLPALEKFQPELIYISAGFDAHEQDPLAKLRLTTQDYVWMTQWIMDIAARFAKGRIISVLEGGYSLKALAESATAHIRTLAKL
jgi:acetoin utilization deacetylase AcuC-like enzyme